MKRTVSLAVVVAMVMTQLAAAAGLEDGVAYLKQARKAQLSENEADEKEFLSKALAEFQKDTTQEGLLLAFYAGHRIGRDAEIKERAVEFVKGHRRDFDALVQNQPVMTPDEAKATLEYLTAVESRIPFIEAVRLQASTIFPYRGDKPTFGVTLNSGADITLALDGAQVARTAGSHGESFLATDWSERYLDRSRFDFAFNAVNETARDSKSTSILVNTYLPEGLERYSSSFRLRGREFKPETRTRKKLKRPIWLTIVGALAVGVAFAAESAWKNSPEGNAYATCWEQRHGSGGCPGGEPAWIIGFGIGGMVLSFAGLLNFILPPMATEPDRDAIAQNTTLRREIESKKAAIRIDLQETER